MVNNNDYRYLLQDLKRASARAQPKINPHQKLSLCMIVKNEENYLADALKSAQDVVDEIIIVDTGSTDRTVEIAREFGAKIHYFEWQDDFSAARNESLKHATGDWVLVMDADERIPENVKDNLRLLLAPVNQFICYLVYIKSYMKDMDEGDTLGHYMARLFKKMPETMFFGAIHEQVYPNWGEVLLPEETFHLVHLGYQDRSFKMDKLANRNIPIIRKAVEKAKETNPHLYSFYAFYLGNSLSDTPESQEEALYWLKEAIQTSQANSAPHYVMSYMELIAYYFKHGKFEEALHYAKEGLKNVPSFNNYPDFWDLYGSIELECKNLDLAIDYFNRAIALNSDADHKEQQVFHIARTTRGGGWGTLVNLGIAFYLKGEHDKAQDYINQALESYPNPDKSRLANYINRIKGGASLTQEFFEKSLSYLGPNDEAFALNANYLSNLYLKQEKPFEALILQSQLHGLEVAIKAGLDLAQIYQANQRDDLARLVYQAILELEPTNFKGIMGLQILNWVAEGLASFETDQYEFLAEKCSSADDWFTLGEFCIKVGDPEKAKHCFDKVLKENPQHYQTNLYLALMAQMQGETEKAIDILQVLIKEHPRSFSAHTQLGNLYLSINQFSQAEQIFRELEQKQSEIDWYTYYALGLALSGQNQFSAAESYLQKAIEKDQTQTSPHELLKMIEEAQKAAN